MSTYLLRKGWPSEDAFTGMLADLMAWWPEHALGLLGRARRFSGGHVDLPAGISAGHEGELVVSVWPQWASGEPDLVLEFKRAGGNRSMIIVEAKLGAAKSSADAGEMAPGESRDQLAKYHRDAAAGLDRPGAPAPDRIDVVYLTHHSGAPVADLTDSFKAIEVQQAPHGEGALYWLSWSDIEVSIRGALESASGAWAGAMASVAAVLRQEGYECFSGTWRPDVPEPPRGLLPCFVPRLWRAPIPLLPLGEGYIFWGSHGNRA